MNLIHTYDMWKKLLICLIVVLLGAAPSTIKPVIDLPYWETKHGEFKPGWEDRGEEYIKWLAPSVRVTAWPNGGGGSGTICYYDAEEKWVYVITCGHLYASTYRNTEYYKKNPNYKNVTVYYQNTKKLDTPKSYKAETLCSVWDGIFDVALVRFKADWEPDWVISIAPEDYKLEKGMIYHSLGCDGLNPVAHYLIKYDHSETHDRGSYGPITEHLTTENGPRKGRSGGGVMTDDYQLIMICSRGDNRYAYWSSIQQIHKFFNKEGFKFILDGGNLANKIPIKDRNNPQGEYPKDYIPKP